jgi:tetratricopeptide (TPR) repeat protein
LEQALAANPTGRSREKARDLWALSMILQWQGKIDAARPLAEEGLELWRETNDRLELALALESVGWSQYTKNDYVAALRSMEECVDLYRELGSEKLVTRGRVAVGQMLAALGDVERTETLARERWRRVVRKANPKSYITHYIIWLIANCGAEIRKRLFLSTQTA